VSTKEQIIHLIQALPEDATLSSVLQMVQKEYDTEEALGRLGEQYGIPDGDFTDDEWRAVIAHSWADSLNAPREDIYTAEDGEPAENS